MGHHIQAFVGTKDAIAELLTPINYQSPYCYDLPQGYWLLLCDYNPFADLVYQYLQHQQWGLSPNPGDHFIQYAQCNCKQGTVGYIETDYFGGIGRQSAILIDKGRADIFLHNSRKHIDMEKDSIYPMALTQSPINTILARIGVQAHGGMDRFDSIHLSEYREMPPY